MKSNGFWLILLGGIILISAVISVLLLNIQTSYVNIYKDGVLTETINLAAVTEPFTRIIGDTEGNDSNVLLPRETGRLNMIEIETGRIRMLGANCPDGLCVDQGWISSGIVPIVCLPNRVIITMESAEKAYNVDAVVG